ncbi:hypothetical protein [Sorangium sp. So ce854]|uniref:hypothetical protein n=1 Tax=Sorangium sp. So ce854 TaxID=3133322 RepID=UPI003F6168E7
MNEGVRPSRRARLPQKQRRVGLSQRRSQRKRRMAQPRIIYRSDLLPSMHTCGMSGHNVPKSQGISAGGSAAGARSGR